MSGPGSLRGGASVLLVLDELDDVEKMSLVGRVSADGGCMLRVGCVMTSLFSPIVSE